MNVNYRTDTDWRRQLGSNLNSYNHFSMVHIPTSNQNGSNSATNNIFNDISAFTNCKTIPIINGLSDHNARVLIIKELHIRNGTNYMKSIWQ